jgi:hypothetical protein
MVRDRALRRVLMAMFLCSSRTPITGLQEYNATQREHGEPHAHGRLPGPGIHGKHLENWRRILQMAVLLTTWLVRRAHRNRRPGVKARGRVAYFAHDPRPRLVRERLIRSGHSILDSFILLFCSVDRPRARWLLDYAPRVLHPSAGADAL